MKKYSKRRFLLLEEAGEAAQDVAKLGACDCAGKIGEATTASGTARQKRQHLQQREGAAGRGVDRRHGSTEARERECEPLEDGEKIKRTA